MYVLLLSALVCYAGATTPVTNTTLATRACQGKYAELPFCNPQLTIDQRVQDLISRLNRSEMALLLKARPFGADSPPPPNNISRLGIPAFSFGLNALHGVQSECVQYSGNGSIVCPSSLPPAPNYGMTFNKTAFLVLGQIIGVEARALWLAGAVEESDWSQHCPIGLTVWSPNINMMVDPRWGRNQETPSEDSYLTGLFGALHTQGLQVGADPRYIQTGVTIKHWAVYNLEVADGYTRHNFTANISNYGLIDYYFVPFRMAIEGNNAVGVMCAYNGIYYQGKAIPSCAHPLLNKFLRDIYKFDGYMTSDTAAITDVYQNHHYVANASAAACVSIRDGICDIDSGPEYTQNLMDGVDEGLCTMDDVRRALTDALKVRFRLGLFEPNIDDMPYWHVPLDAVNTTASREHNYLTTQESMVLLKNKNNLLPLKPGAKKVAVIGPHYRAKGALVSNYLGQLCHTNDDSCLVTPLEAITALNGASNTVSSQGCNVTRGTVKQRTDAMAVAQAADIIILMFGIDDTVEAEALDRTSIDLPAPQHELAAALTALGKPTILVLINGGMLAIEPEMASVDAIIEAGYPGIFGSQVIAETIFGLNSHLGGKLPYTVYPADYVDQIKISTAELTQGPGRTYKYYRGRTLYPFGYGLAYTTFTLAAPAKPQLSFNTGDNSTVITVKIVVTNTGSVTGDEVVQVYIVPKSLPQQPNHPLIKQLVNFERVHLDAGDSTTLSFPVFGAQFNLVDPPTGDLISTPGSFDYLFTNGVDQNVTLSATLTGSQVVLEKFPTEL